MKDICNKLLETYDTRFLDNLDKETKQIWNDTTRKTLSSKNPFIKNNANLVLSRLVQNHFNNNKPITDLLSGPMSFTLQKSEKYDMSVYIFGEYHGLEDDCKQFLKTKKGKKCKKKCKKKQICNRKTGRCINKEGKIGKEIIKQNSTSKKEYTYIYTGKLSTRTPNYNFNIKLLKKIYDFLITEKRLEKRLEKVFMKSLGNLEYNDLEIDFDKVNNIVKIKFTTINYMLENRIKNTIIQLMEDFDKDCNSFKFFGNCLYLNNGNILEYSIDNKYEELEIQDYFKKLLTTTDVFLDLYVEVPQFLKSRYNFQYTSTYSYLQKIFKGFRNCIQTETRVGNSDCELFRFHYIDIRKKDDKSPDLVIENFLKDIDNNIISESSKGLLEILSFIDKEDLFEIYLNDIENNFYIQKELSKTPLKNEILKHCNDTAKVLINKFANIKKIKKNSKILLDKYRKNAPLNYSESITLKSFRNIFTKLGARAVDVYTLSRLFRYKFKSNKNQPEGQHNIIMYAGDRHSKVYRSFLKKLKFLTIETSGNNYKGVRKSTRCLELNNISQPLFN